MTTLKQRLEDLLKENKARASARNEGLINQAPTVKKGTAPKKDPAGSWPDLRGLSDEKMLRKLERLPEDEMLELYKKLEREMDFRIDPENYKRHKIIKNFMLLWTGKIELERRAAAAREKYGEPLEPLSGDEVDQVMSNRGRSHGIAGKVTRISDNEPF